MKTTHEQPLWWKLYLRDDRVYLEAAKIIGYLGCSPTEFYDAAKQLPSYDRYKFERAVGDLTVYARRQPPILRYELTPQARKVCRVLLGAPPEDPGYADWWRQRLDSVRLMRERGEAVTRAAEPPAPLGEPKPKKPRRRAKKAG